MNLLNILKDNLLISPVWAQTSEPCLNAYVTSRALGATSKKKLYL